MIGFITIFLYNNLMGFKNTGNNKMSFTELSLQSPPSLQCGVLIYCEQILTIRTLLYIN